MNGLEFFSNDYYKILKFINDNQIEIKGDKYSSYSQQEMADALHFSKVKVNKMIKDLITSGYIQVFKNIKGKYQITDSGRDVIYRIGVK